MAMSKRHFEALARIVRDSDATYAGKNGSASYTLACKLADFCETENPAFDRERFMKACGVTP